MSNSHHFAVPQGYYEPFAIISDSDRGGCIIIATAIGLAMAIMSTVIRIYVKAKSRQQAGVDDVLLACATVVAFVQHSVILAACSKGLGRSVDLLHPTALHHVEKAFYSSQLLTPVVLGLCKCSVAYFIMRLTPDTSLRRVLQSIIACVGAWIVASLLTFALQCNFSYPWALTAGVCTGHGIYVRIVVIGILDVVLELALFGAAILLVGGLQTVKLKKFTVIMAFGLRLPIIALICARLVTFDKDRMNDFAVAESLYVIWTVTQINYSLVSTTLPILRPFVKDLATCYGGLRPTEYSGSCSRSRSGSYPLSTLKSSRRITAKGSFPSQRNPSTSQDESMTFDFTPRIPNSRTTTYIEADAHSGPSRISEEPYGSSHSLESQDSRRMIIRVEQEWTVEHRDA